MEALQKQIREKNTKKFCVRNEPTFKALISAMSSLCSSDTLKLYSMNTTRQEPLITV